MLRKRKYFYGVLIFIVLIVIALLGYVTGKSIALNNLEQQLSTNGTEIKKQLEFELSRYKNTALVYSKNHQIQQFMSNKVGSSEQVSQFLIEISNISSALDVYLLSPDGVVVAASNYRQTASFVGNDFSFRDYFKGAALHGEGFELAVGKVSHRRGIYFSKAIFDQKKLVGIFVIKADVAAMEQRETLFPNTSFSFMLQSRDHTIFLSDQPDWRLLLFDTSTDLLRQESQLEMQPMIRWHKAGFDMWKVNSKHPQQYLIHQDVFEQYPWQLKVLAKDDEATRLGAFTSLIANVIFILFVFMSMWFYERRKNSVQLQRSHQKLTAQVALRTADLTETNAILQLEVEQRAQAERDLIATQEQLIQAAKLATIGELSSSINHEINQPLAALSSYLQLTEKMLEKRMYDKAGANINNMHGLIKRLVAIVSQLKNFSRKTNEPMRDVSLSQIVDNAIAICGHHIVQHKVRVDLQPPEALLTVVAEPIQLEQVIINLLTNAVDALKDVEHPMISIRLLLEQRPVLEISDNGIGIEPHYLNKIFEPFFTTKSASGLGLGLSISRRIIESFNGELNVDNLPTGGAVFQIRFA